MADEAEIREVIRQTSEASSNQEFGARDPTQATANASKMESTNYLRSTGLLDAYEAVVSNMVEEGWPAE